MKLFAIAVAFSASLVASVASAAPVTWTIPSTPVTGGRTISGTFVFDTSLPATQRLVSINVVETGPTPTTYAFTGDVNGDYYLGQPTAVTTIHARAIAIQLPAIPATAGGNYTVPIIFVDRCISLSGDKCFSLDTYTSVSNVGITSAAPTPAPVPTMTEWAMILFGTILAGGAALYIQRRRQFA